MVSTGNRRKLELEVGFYFVNIRTAFDNVIFNALMELIQAA